MIMKKNYSADTTTWRHCLTMMKNYFIDTMISEHLFWDILHSPLLPLKRPYIEKDYDNTFLPPQTPTVEALKPNFVRFITNLIDKANNITEMVPKNKKKDLDKWDQKINELPIPQLTQILSKIDKVRYQNNLSFLREVKAKNLKIK